MKTKILSFEEYVWKLRNEGYEVNESNIEIIRRKYEKLKKSLSNKLYNLNKKRRAIVLTREEDALLRDRAKAEGISPTAYIKRCLKAVLQSSMSVVQEVDRKAIVSEIARIGNNVNQAIRLAHQLKSIHLDQVLKLQEVLLNLSEWVQKKWQGRPDLIDELRFRMASDAQFAKEVIEVVWQHISTKLDGCDRNM